MNSWLWLTDRESTVISRWCEDGYGNAIEARGQKQLNSQNEPNFIK
jgi:hypothetical protein